MKLQDILFFIALLLIILFRRGRYAWHAGMLCFVLSGILFAIGNLFTSQRLTWYGAAFIAVEVIRLLISDLRRGLKGDYA